MTITVYSAVTGLAIAVFSEVTDLVENADGSFSFKGKKNGTDKVLPYKFQASAGVFFCKES